jgi:hypothetical protein
MRTAEACGLSIAESIMLVCAHLFEPKLLKKHMDYQDALNWTIDFLTKLRGNDIRGALEQYDSSQSRMAGFYRELPPLSLTAPPFSIASLDGLRSSLPWRSPGHGRVLIETLMIPVENSPFPTSPFIAFITHGPGDTRETAFRTHGPTQAVRASSEHWLMRGLLPNRPRGPHLTLVPDEQRRRFSLHQSTTPDAPSLFFETTRSFGRELKDLKLFLDDYAAGKA